MTNPQLITTPFAENGTKNTIPESGSAEPQLATMQAGFPEITEQKISDGGIPPERADFNGILNMYGQHIVHLNKGLPYEFDQDFADKIDGYPLNARINRNDGVRVRSTVANNTTNPNTSMVGWEIDSLSPSQNLSELTDKAIARTNLDVYSKAETNNIAATPNATEEIEGKAKIATTAIAQAGTNDTDIITAKKLRDALNATGDLPIACFRSHGYVKTSGATVTLAKQLNVASVVRVSTGIYAVTFSKPMPDTNYLILLGVEGNGGQDFIKISPKESKTVNGFSITLFASTGPVDGTNFSFGVIT